MSPPVQNAGSWDFRRGYIRGTLALDEGVFRSHHLPGRPRKSFSAGWFNEGGFHGLGRLAPERSFGPASQTLWYLENRSISGVAFWYAGSAPLHTPVQDFAPKERDVLSTNSHRIRSMPTNSDSASEPAQGTPQVPASFQGSLRLFHFAGVDVFIHWSGSSQHLILIRDRSGALFVDGLGCCGICGFVFGFVLMYEFGHVLACRLVGGTANRIWPLWPPVGFRSPCGQRWPVSGRLSRDPWLMLPWCRSSSDSCSQQLRRRTSRHPISSTCFRHSLHSSPGDAVFNLYPHIPSRWRVGSCHSTLAVRLLGPGFSLATSSGNRPYPPRLDCSFPL